MIGISNNIYAYMYESLYVSESSLPSRPSIAPASEPGSCREALGRFKSGLAGSSQRIELQQAREAAQRLSP